MSSNYYLDHKKRIQREIKRALPHYRRFIVEAYGVQMAKIIIAETLERFAALLPGIPYIGGDENRLTVNLYLSAAMLAFYQALKTQGKSVDEAGRIIYQGTASMYVSFPFNAMLWWAGRKTFSRKRLEKLRWEAAASQARQYPGDWVYNFVPGDGQKILFGLDYIECGIFKYLAGQGAPELAHYLCWLDYPMCAAMRMGLIRTKTLALGDKKCNFRYCREEQPEIKPDFMKN